MNTPVCWPKSVAGDPPVDERGVHRQSQGPSSGHDAGIGTVCRNSRPLAAAVGRPAPRVGRALAVALATWIVSMLGLSAAGSVAAHAGTGLVAGVRPSLSAAAMGTHLLTPHLVRSRFCT